MRVLFLKDWQGENSASYQKDQIAEIDDNLAWNLALQGIVKFKKTPDPEVEKLKEEAKKAKKEARKHAR